MMQSYESSEWNTDDLQNGMCCVAKRMISVTIKCHSPIQWLPKASSSTSSVIEEKELPIVRLLECITKRRDGSSEDEPLNHKFLWTGIDTRMISFLREKPQHQIEENTSIRVFRKDQEKRRKQDTQDLDRAENN
ncbi:unnamed protein product [Caenorhabditis nigoni]